MNNNNTKRDYSHVLKSAPTQPQAAAPPVGAHIVMAQMDADIDDALAKLYGNGGNSSGASSTTTTPAAQPRVAPAGGLSC